MYLGQQLDPDGKVIHASRSSAQSGPHVEPVLQTHRGHGHLARSEGLVPGDVVGQGLPLPLHLLQHALQECSVVVNNGEESWIILLPASNVPEQLIQTLHVILIDEPCVLLIQTLEQVAQLLNL